MTLTALMERDGVTSTARAGATTTPEDFWAHDAWTVTLRRQGKRLTVPFFMGTAYNGTQPKAWEVLECLLSDASSADRNFEEWCSEFGDDPDSRKSERTYRACCRTRKRLVAWLGASFDDYLYADLNEE